MATTKFDVNKTLVIVNRQAGLTVIQSGTPLTRLNYFDGKFLRARTCRPSSVICAPWWNCPTGRAALALCTVSTWPLAATTSLRSCRGLPSIRRDVC